MARKHRPEVGHQGSYQLMGRIQQKFPSHCDRAEALNGGGKVSYPLELSCLLCFSCLQDGAWVVLSGKIVKINISLSPSFTI